MDGDEHTDDVLVQRIGEGDEQAFVALYRRYFEQVFDFAIRMTRDRDTAALVVQSTFLRVAQGLRSGGATGPFKVVLFATARSDVRERLRRRHGPPVDHGEGFDIGAPSRLSNPAFAAELPDLARAAWRASLELSPDDFELLDLHVRRQLHAGELAAILRSRPEQADSKLAGILRKFEVSFAALLLYGVGRRACVDLDFVLAEDDWTPALRRRVQRHYQSCQTCQTTRRRYPGANEIFASLTPVLAPAGWEDAMRERLVEAMRSGAAVAPPVAVGATVPPPPARQAEPFEPAPVTQRGGDGGGGLADWLSDLFGGDGNRGPLVALLGGALLLIVIIVAGVCAVTGSDGGGDDETATPTVTPTGSVTETPTLTGTLTTTPTGTVPPAVATPTSAATATPPPAATSTAPPAATPTTRPPTATPRPPTPTVALPTPTTAP